MKLNSTLVGMTDKGYIFIAGSPRLLFLSGIKNKELK